MCVPETVSRPRRVQLSIPSTHPSKSHNHPPAYIPTSDQWCSHCVNTTAEGDSYSDDKRIVLIDLDKRGLEGNKAVGSGGKPRKCGHSHHLWDFFLSMTCKFVIVKTVKCSVHIVH